LLPPENATGNFVKVVPARAGQHRVRRAARPAAICSDPGNRSCRPCESN